MTPTAVDADGNPLLDADGNRVLEKSSPFSSANNNPASVMTNTFRWSETMQGLASMYPVSYTHLKTVLAALDSQYIHTNLAIRCLASCCKEPPVLRDYNINQEPFLILKDLLSLEPDVVGFSCLLYTSRCV